MHKVSCFWHFLIMLLGTVTDSHWQTSKTVLSVCVYGCMCVCVYVCMRVCMRVCMCTYEGFDSAKCSARLAVHFLAWRHPLKVFRNVTSLVNIVGCCFVENKKAQGKFDYHKNTQGNNQNSKDNHYIVYEKCRARRTVHVALSKTFIRLSLHYQKPKTVSCV